MLQKLKFVLEMAGIEIPQDLEGLVRFIRGAGGDVELTEVPMGVKPAAAELEAIAAAAVMPGAQFYRVVGSHGGQSLVAFVVVREG